MGLQELADRLREARRSLAPIPQLTVAEPGLTVGQAYEVQRLLTADLQRSGYKMGLTSLAKQREVGVSSAIRGVLLKDDVISNGGTTPRTRYIHPRSEPEIVFLLKHDLKGDASEAEIRSAISAVHIGLEVIDSRYRDFKFTLPDVIADNTSAAGYVIGDRIDVPLSDLPGLEVTLSKNGAPAQKAKAEAILGDPFRSLVELIKLTPLGVPAGPVLAGGVTQSVPFESGDVIEASCATGARAWFRAV